MGKERRGGFACKRKPKRPQGIGSKTNAIDLEGPTSTGIHEHTGKECLPENLSKKLPM